MAAQVHFNGIQTVVTYVKDMATSCAFYETVLGLERVYDSDGVVAFDGGGPRILIHPAGQREASAQAGQEVYWNVSDVDALVETARAAGARIVEEPTDVPWGEREAAFLDPDGHRINLTQPGPDSWAKQ
jgi:catechol 2,3-dioxygenase-like lactoylglutathione lyase family enzyme